MIIYQHKRMNMQTITPIPSQATTFESQPLESTMEKLLELRARKCDITIPVADIEMVSTGDFIVTVKAPGQEPYDLMLTPTDIAIKQISQKMGIPLPYWRRLLKDNLPLAAQNFNSWAAWERNRATTEDKARERSIFVRAYWDNDVHEGTGTMRAFLSDGYFSVDQYSLLIKALQVTAMMKEQRGLDIQVAECSLTDEKFYVRFICPSIQRQSRELLENYRDPNGGEFGGVGQDYGIVTGYILSNSEVGYGQLLVSPMCYIRACANNMIWRSAAFARRHLGSKMVKGLFSRETEEKNLELIESQISDSIKDFLSEETLGAMVKDLDEMGRRVLQHPSQVITNLVEEIKLSEDEGKRVLEMFYRGGSTKNAFDVAQAMTASAKFYNSDRRTQLEEKATEIMSFIDKIDRPA